MRSLPSARRAGGRALRALGALTRDGRARVEPRALRALGVGVGAGVYDDRPDAVTLRRLLRMRARNLTSREPIVGDASVVVVMTTVASRIAFVWAAIESIGAGSVRPARIILWLDDPTLDVLPRSLTRLQARGLEVQHVAPGLGVHTKWRPHVLSERAHRLPMATSDDDQLYPADWLEQLLHAGAKHPDAVVAHRAHEIRCIGDAVGPYLSWPPATSTRPSFAHFGTSVSGQLLPAALLDALRDGGDGFLDRTPHQDDVWLHASAVAHGFRTAQVTPVSQNFPFVPGTQTAGLYVGNVFGDGNDLAVAAALEESQLERIRADAAELCGDGSL
ncbi:hypothetical protein [Agrococcus sp. Ld7]|uniref:hypothetical protein n=1 Tax=Agrococcus sp. Ld7 TaxID=649148 RepID=UPI00386F7875